MFMTLTAFLVTCLVSNRYGSDKMVYFRGLVNEHPLMAVSFTIILFSLAGVPPFGGFIAKFNIISAAIDSKLYTISFIAAINSVIALYYYLRLAKTMILDPSDGKDQLRGASFVSHLVVAGLTIPVILLGIFWGKIYHLYSFAKLYIDS